MTIFEEIQRLSNGLNALNDRLSILALRMSEIAEEVRVLKSGSIRDFYVSPGKISSQPRENEALAKIAREWNEAPDATIASIPSGELFNACLI